MSSELDRLLRDARGALPAPDEHATHRARGRSLASIRSRRRRARVLVVAGAMIATVVALGVSAGSLSAPDVTAAREPAILGFVPEPGWYALQSPPPAIPGQQTAAVASNVPLAADDVENGLVEPSGLPYATLLTLPPDGIVLVSTMTPQSVPQVSSAPPALPYTDVELPLRLRDAIPITRWGARLRPDQPLAQYQLSGSLRGYNVDVIVYFGTAQPSAELMRQAQHQLDGFVFRPGDASSAVAAKDAAASSAGVAVVDRTYACDAVLLGGVYALKSRAHAGIRSGSEWSKLAYAVVASGGWAGPLTGLPNAPGNSLAWITAGAPAPSTTVDTEAEVFPVLGGGTLGVNTSLCRPSRANVTLSRSGLRGGNAPRESVGFECIAPRRLFVRFRATVQGSTALRERARIFLATNTPTRDAQLVVRTPSGKLLTFASVDRAGRAQLYTARGCSRR